MKILSLRGGGIRGLAVAIALAELERVTRRPCHQLFDFITGTSTGGILAIALGLGIPAAKLSDFYIERGPRIFRKRLLLGLFGAKYDVAVLRRELNDVFGGAPLRECKVPVMVTMIAKRNNGARFAKSWKHGSLRAADAATATSAAPHYFAPWDIPTEGEFEGGQFRDGGMFGNNPAPYAAVELLDPNFPGFAVAPHSMVDIAPPCRAPESFDGNGLIHVGSHLVDLFMDSGADANATVARRLLGAERYLQVSGPLGSASPAMDDASEPNLAALVKAGQAMAAAHMPAIERLLTLQ